MAVCNYFHPDNRVFRAADALQEIGFDVTILAFYKEGLKKEETLGCGFILKRLELITPIKKPGQLANYFRYLDFQKKAKLFAKIHQPDAVHCHDYNTLFLGIYCKKTMNAQLVYDNHEYFQDLTYLHRYPLLVRKRIARFERQTIKKWVDHMIVVSDGIANAYKKITGMEAVVVRNIPDFRQTEANEDQQVSYEHYKTSLQKLKDEGHELLLYLGTNFSRGRGLEFIISLLKHLPENYLLIIFGCKSKAEIKQLEQIFKEKNINERIKTFQFISLPVLFKLKDFFSFGLSIIEPIYFSYNYSLPNKLFEYIAMEIPVIVSDIPEQKKIVEAYNNGIVADLTQVESTAQQILKSQIDFSIGIGKAKEELIWEKEKQKLIGIYLA